MKPSTKDSPAFESAAARLHSASSFQSAASLYDAARPSYPPAVAELVPPGSTVLDVGAGTGQLAAPLAARGHEVYACEPASAMVRVFRSQHPTIPVWRAAGEATALRAKSVDVYASAQAWHWFDAAAASAEADRVVRDGGRLVLCWNTLDVSHPWVLRLSRIAHSGDIHREGFCPDVRSPWTLVDERRVTWLQPATPEDLFDLMATRSYWLRASASTRARMTENLTWYLYQRLGFEPGQLLPLPYRTDAFAYSR
ncbi:class I SAM-dependent methyltransferase [Corynebacterium capitovis]|uniref:class I SAM-dependent methyltransferase n=1 Tax=Corynebacterium capitovis TaxID=131081 RepID=UPI00037BF14C|nr:class I SAM-dependent methyltransferase [Corynebacterium capitovis]